MLDDLGRGTDDLGRRMDAQVNRTDGQASLVKEDIFYRRAVDLWRRMT